MEDTNSFFNYLMMQPAMFDEILSRVGPRIQKKDINMFGIHATLLLFMIGLHYNHEVQVAMCIHLQDALL